MPTIQTGGLAVVAIYVTDLDRAIDFYVNHLGFVETQDMPPGSLLKAGNLTIYLEGGKQADTADRSHFPRVSMALEHPHVKQACEAAKASGLKITMDYVEYGPDFGMFRLADPDGNEIEFAGVP